nr:ORFIII-like polyprotein [Tanacetum cinerariifolium]
MVQDTPIEEAAFMEIEESNESDDEQDIEEGYDSHHAFMFHLGPPTKIADMVQSAGSLNYPKCQLTSCALCAKKYLGKTVNVKRKQQHKPEEEKDFSSNEVRLLKELLKEKTEQVQQMIKDQAKEYYEGKIAIKEKEELWQTERSLLEKEKKLKEKREWYSITRFHQVAMDEESIPWTAFLVPGGFYEWLVMPFGLKNAPADSIKLPWMKNQSPGFIAVYIDDILVFSKNETEHAKHLEKMLKICEDNGLVLSPTKMKIAVSTIDFLRVVIGERTIKLQPHIIKKIVNFNEEELKTKKGLRSFLGILNYARNHIPKLEILLRPLYEKTNAHGDKRMKKIKEQVQNLPDLEIPPENAYIILETDGCMEGSGGTVKWKKSKEDPRECTGEMKELAAAALHSVEKVLHSKPTKPQSKWINIMHGDQSLKTLSCQQQKKQLKPCGTYKKSYNEKPKYALGDQPKTTTGQIKEKMFESKTRKPEESSSNWKPLHRDWDATTSNFLENDYHYNRKGFLEDDDARSDDSIFIVDPGWDDYCLQAIKLNRPISFCPNARRA